MIKCKLCGYTSKCRIIEHLVKVHKYDITKYKEQYGPVITDAYKTEVSNRSIKKWKNIAYRPKQMMREMLYGLMKNENNKAK